MRAEEEGHGKGDRFKLDELHEAEAQLLGRVRLMVFPVLLGEGKRFFPEGEAKHPLKLIEAKTVGDGISVVRYERA